MPGGDDGFADEVSANTGTGPDGRLRTGAKPDTRPAFEKWRNDFLADAREQGLLHNAEQLGDFALRLFWEQGIPPTVEAVVASGNHTPRPSNGKQKPAP